jgi:chromosome segregation ATPase
MNTELKLKISKTFSRTIKMPQRKPQNKLPEIGECLELLQSLESNLSEDDFQTIVTVKEYLDVIKAKWKTLNTNYNNLFQEKINYEGEIEKFTQALSKLNEEKVKYLDEIKNLDQKMSSLDSDHKFLTNAFESSKAKIVQLMDESKKQIEQFLLKEKEWIDGKLEIDQLNEKLMNELNQVKNQFLDKEKELDEIKETAKMAAQETALKVAQAYDQMKAEKDSLYSILESKTTFLLSENNDLLLKLKTITDNELKNKNLIEELCKQKDNVESKLQSLAYEKDKELEILKDQFQNLQNQKKNAENLLNELTIKLDKKSKCCIM